MASVNSFYLCISEFKKMAYSRFGEEDNFIFQNSNFKMKHFPNLCMSAYACG